MTNRNARSDLDSIDLDSIANTGCMMSHTGYAITIKHMNKNKIDYQDDLYKFIKTFIRPYFDIKHVTYEEDSQHRLHAHILGFSPKSGIKLRPIRYWSVDVQETENAFRWLSYITKYVKTEAQQDEILLKHASYHNNLFIEP